jgi:serine protease Do
LVITNQHVVEGAEQVVVTTRDGTDYPARVLGEDPLTDIAVLRIDRPGPPAAPIGSSRDLVIGEWVVAIGNPFGYLLGNSEPTVTAGVVSGVGRNLLPSARQSGIYVGMIQTDAAINPGNSGGPLVNSLGEVVGVNSSILSNSGGSDGLGFAIPIERALRVADELTRHGTVRRAWVGLDVVGSEGMRDWKEHGGLAVTSVADGSPAGRGGLRAGDVLIEARGHRLRTFLDWEAVKLDIGPGDTVAVQVARAGRPRTVQLVVEPLPTSRAEKVDVLGGLRLITVTPAVRQERGVLSESGALIYDLPAETRRQTGLRPGDVIRQISRLPIERAEDVARAFDAARGRGWIRLHFEREGRLNFADFYIR